MEGYKSPESYVVQLPVCVRDLISSTQTTYVSLRTTSGANDTVVFDYNSTLELEAVVFAVAV